MKIKRTGAAHWGQLQGLDDAGRLHSIKRLSSSFYPLLWRAQVMAPSVLLQVIAGPSLPFCLPSGREGQAEQGRERGLQMIPAPTLPHTHTRHFHTVTFIILGILCLHRSGLSGITQNYMHMGGWVNMQSWLAWNLLCGLGYLWTHRDLLLLPSEHWY